MSGRPPKDWIALFGPKYTNDPRLDLAIESAESMLAESGCLAPIYSQAVARLALHILTLADRDDPNGSGGGGGGGGSTVGPVTSVRTGDLSVTFAAPASSSQSDFYDWLRLTGHGIALVAMIETYCGGVDFVPTTCEAVRWR